MKNLIALAAAGLIATTASAQSNMMATNQTAPATHTMSTTHKMTTMEKHTTMPMAHRAHRVCHTHWRHHKKIRTCRTTRM